MLLEYILNKISERIKKINKKTYYLRYITKQNKYKQEYYQIQKGLFYGLFWIDALEITSEYISLVCFMTTIGARSYIKEHNTILIKLNEKHRTDKITF